MFFSENRLEISLRSVKLKLDEWPEALEFNLDDPGSDARESPESSSVRGTCPCGRSV